MKTIAECSKCSNCGACINICPVNAITVEKQQMFYTVRVDQTSCVRCGKCVSVCPVNTPKAALNLQAAYVGRHSEQSVVAKSSSGGAFSALAEYFLEQGGVVYGAAFSSDCKEVIIQSTKKVRLDDLRRSKYVESLTGYSFREVAEDLKYGKPVLFCGTPCQVAGLKRFLNAEYDNLFTCDFSCGGLASHQIYQDHIHALEEKYHAKACSVNFRPKLTGWTEHTYEVVLGKHTYRQLAALDPYFYLFLGHYSTRPYCVTCDFADNHYADFILADYWKYQEREKYRNENKGLSLVLTNSEKADQLMRQKVLPFVWEEIGLEDGSYNIERPTTTESMMDRREKLLKCYAMHGLDATAIACGMATGKKRLILSLKFLVKRVLRGVK